MKFGDALSAQLTPEWRSQYIKYDEAKAMLIAHKESEPIADDTNAADIERLINDFETRFFDLMEKELQKINIFFLEKLNEAKRKYAKHCSDLDDFLKYQQMKHTKKRNDPLDVTFHDPKALKSLSIHDFRLAFSEFYLSLTMLQNFQQLNLTGFRKILKKHDKILATSRGGKWRQDTVLNSDFATSKAVEELLGDVERDVTEKLEGGDHKKAMKRLRVPPLGQPYHSGWTVFRIGMWCGLLALFFVILAALVPWSDCDPSSKGCWHHDNDPANFTDPLADDVPRFWEVTIRLYRGIFLFSLMIFLLGVNVHGWRAAGVNHVLIFELDPRDHLSSLHLIEAGIALLVFCSASLTVWLLQFYIAYVTEININIIRYSSFAFIIFLIIFLINPLPFFMYTSRMWLLKILFRVVTAPFHKVRFPDFWLADQLTSLVPVFQDFVFIICTCSLRFHPDHVQNYCDKSLFVVKQVISCLPAWFRFSQCLRRYRDSKKKHPHLTNAGKYSTTFFVILFRSLHAAWETGSIGTEEVDTSGHNLSNSTDFEVEIENVGGAANYSSSNPFLYLWIISATISTIYTYTWDIKMDWGLFDPNCGENRFLREHIVYRYKLYYYLAIGIDLVLRLTWTVTVADFDITEQQYITDIFITALTFVEMFRRFIWNFFRLENEHVNNAGEFRAVRDISIKPILNEDIRAVERMMTEEDGANAVRHDRRSSFPTIQSNSKSKFDFATALTMTQNAAAPFLRRLKLTRGRERSSTSELQGKSLQELKRPASSSDPTAVDVEDVVESIIPKRQFTRPRFSRQESAQTYESFRKKEPVPMSPVIDKGGDSDDD